MSLLPDYSGQAKIYDGTRAASPSIMAPLRAALDGTPGRQLADVGGGTGNYAEALRDEGWEPTVVDRSPEMLQRAKAKGLKAVEADAQHLPFDDASFDAVTMISMLHHVEDWRAALAEGRRVLRPKGRLVLKGWAREDVMSLWVLDYFPVSRSWMEGTHQPRVEILGELPDARLIPLEFQDVEDASLGALAAEPELLLAAAEAGDTSFFERMWRDHPDELEAGLARLREDIDAGSVPRRPGTATVLSWAKP